MKILERFDDGSVIALLEIDKLHDHEQIKQKYQKELCEQIRRDGEVKYPLIVDKYSNVVLDGHHRFYSLKDLGCKYAPAHIVDYYDPHIKVERWCPLVKTRNEVKAVFKALSKNEFIIEEVENEDVLKIVLTLEQASIGMIVENEHEEYYMAHKENASYDDTMKIIKDAIDIVSRQKELDYVADEKEIMTKLKSREATMAIITPIMTKKRVVETAETKTPMPPKSTRHVMPEKKYYPVLLADLMPEQ